MVSYRTGSPRRVRVGALPVQHLCGDTTLLGAYKGVENTLVGVENGSGGTAAGESAPATSPWSMLYAL